MAFYRERGLLDIGKEIATEGIGVGGGFIAGGLVGRYTEDFFIKNEDPDLDTIGKKLAAWAANNGPKALIYVLAKYYDAKTEITQEATKALAGSIVYDTILRLANKGYNPANISVGGVRVLSNAESEKIQSMVQENSLLRTELNKALQRLAGIDKPLANQIVHELESSEARRGPGSAADYRYGGVPSPTVADRQTRYGSMPWTPDVMERQRRFGSMPFEQPTQKTQRERKFGFSAANQTGSNIAEMFNMQ